MLNRQKIWYDLRKTYKLLGWDQLPVTYIKKMPFIPFKKLLKKLTKLQNRYNAAEGKPVLRARILRAGVALEAKLEKLKQFGEGM